MLERDGAAGALSLLGLLGLVLATSEFKLVLNWNVNRGRVANSRLFHVARQDASLDRQKRCGLISRQTEISVMGCSVQKVACEVVWISENRSRSRFYFVLGQRFVSYFADDTRRLEQNL